MLTTNNFDGQTLPFKIYANLSCDVILKLFYVYIEIIFNLERILKGIFTG
ncbi:hypothetical protein METHB2_60072 [Candidatus Methylobacter favarea]|uniref:Uncharacterized protein n=1 Tax=Candidatus Methylobacter favarea TaxID=2707345 RepID=A0A8S0WKS6_9GAMM|nr:hypothetical protein METHB2_60072 [Candidatus Methylobacter favarea]